MCGTDNLQNKKRWSRSSESARTKRFCREIRRSRIPFGGGDENIVSANPCPYRTIHNFVECIFTCLRHFFTRRVPNVVGITFAFSSVYFIRPCDCTSGFAALYQIVVVRVSTSGLREVLSCSSKERHKNVGSAFTVAPCKGSCTIHSVAMRLHQPSDDSREWRQVGGRLVWQQPWPISQSEVPAKNTHMLCGPRAYEPYPVYIYGTGGGWGICRLTMF